MEFTAEGLAAIIVAMAGFVSGLYNLMQARRVQSLQDLEKAEERIDTLKDDKREAERHLEIALRHIHSLNLILAREGLEGTPLPKELS